MDKLSKKWMYYSGMLAEMAPICDVNDLKHIQDLIEAEEQGLLLRLPCKVGDTIWCLEEHENELVIYEYVFISVCEEYYIVAPKVPCRNNIEEHLKAMEDDYNFWGSTGIFVFHKSKVFLTKEEAEKALAERGKE